MARLLSDKELIIATHNNGKFEEITALLQPYKISTISAKDFGLPEPIEDGDTFIANAEIKARAASIRSGKPALSDDSGLVIPALGGAPGIHSARWAGPEKNFSIAMEKIEKQMKNQDPQAYFVCALALIWPDGHIEAFEGKIMGSLVWPPRGDRGFGYDPIFLPKGYDITFGEFEPTAKHKISHRAEAFRQLTTACLIER